MTHPKIGNFIYDYACAILNPINKSNFHAFRKYNLFLFGFIIFSSVIIMKHKTEQEKPWHGKSLDSSAQRHSARTTTCNTKIAYAMPYLHIHEAEGKLSGTNIAGAE